MYDLKPFKLNSQASKINIFAEAFKMDNELQVNFIIEDKNSFFVANEFSKAPGRKLDLWNSTCFEAFFGIKGNPGYWEFNVTIAGDWNLYYFDSYRSSNQPKEEIKVTGITHAKEYEDGTWRIETKIPIQNLGLQGQKLQAGFASVVEFKNKEKAYFAIEHGAEKPDFHLRETFLCNLG